MKLRLRERIRFWRDNKLWLKEAGLKSCCGLHFYIARDKDTYIDSSWIAEKHNGKAKLTKISNYGKFNYYCENNEASKGIYFFGEKEIFYKKEGGEPLKKIFNSDCEGFTVFTNIGVVFIYMKDGRDIIADIHSGKIRELIGEKRIVRINSKDRNYYDKFSSAKEVEVIVQEQSKYAYYHIKGDGSVQHENIMFEDYEKFLKHHPIAAVNESGRKLVVSLLEEQQIERYEKADLQNIQQLNEEYFVLHGTEKTEIIRKDNIGEMSSIVGVCPCGKYTIIKEVDDIVILKVKEENGMSCVVISANNVIIRTYPTAVDLEVMPSETLIQGGAVSIGYKLIATYKKEVN